MIGVSIIICCYNSASRLPETLRHLSKQETPDGGLQWEVIVVDNASTDDTKEVAIQEWRKYSLEVPLKVVVENAPGLSYARQKGVEVSRYEYLIFCDDDNWLEANYVSLVNKFMQDNPKVGVVGGCGEEVCEIDPPAWFEDLKGAYAIGKQALYTSDVFERGYVYGAGSAIKKTALNELTNLKFSSLLSDRKGNVLSSGGDGELCFAIQLRGYKVFYFDELRFKHFIPKEKLTDEYITRLLVGFSAAQPTLNLYQYALKGTHISKPMLSLRLMWLKDMVYAIYLMKNLIGKDKLGLKMYAEYVKSLFLMRKSYLDVYFKILSLKL